MATPIKTAILSFGMSGQVFHAPFLHVMDEFELYGVWERSKNIAKEKYPSIKSFRTLEDLLADTQIELVVVNTPNYSHYEYCKKALQAGKHVVVEKPFTVSVKEGKELISLARKQNCLLSVYQNRRYDSDYRTVKKIISEGVLGKIVEAEFHFDRFKLELSPKKHKEIPGPGTGGIYDLGSHLIDQALQLFGMPDALFADIQTLRPSSEVDDYFELLMYYPELRVRLHSSYIVCEPLPAYQVHGSHGSFIKAKTDIQEISLQSGALPGTSGWGKEPESEKGILHFYQDGKETRKEIISERGNYGDYYRSIAESIRNNKPLPVTAEEGLDVIKIIEAAYKSSKEKRVTKLESPVVSDMKKH
jgi:scyllo-inositol 2-dehydrogenase (NADP+)